VLAQHARRTGRPRQRTPAGARRGERGVRPGPGAVDRAGEARRTSPGAASRRRIARRTGSHRRDGFERLAPQQRRGHAMSMIGLFTAAPQPAGTKAPAGDMAAAEGFGSLLQGAMDALAQDAASTEAAPTDAVP